MFTILSIRLEDRRQFGAVVLLEIVDCNITIVETSQQHVRVLRMEVYGHDPGGGLADVLRISWILERKHTNEALLWLIVNII